MLGGTKRKVLFSEVDDTRVVVHDFERRQPFESYRCMEYHAFQGLTREAMLPVLDEHLKLLLAGTVDAANGDMLDGLIIGVYRRAIADLNMQRAGHQDMNRRLNARRAADRADFERICTELREKKETLTKSFEETSRRLAAVEEGKK